MGCWTAAQAVINSLPYLVMVGIGSILMIEFSRRRLEVLLPTTLLLGGSLLTVMSIINTYIKFLVITITNPIHVSLQLLNYYFTSLLALRVVESIVIAVLGLSVVRLIKYFKSMRLYQRI